MKFAVTPNEDLVSLQNRIAEALEKLAAQSASKTLADQAIGTSSTKLPHGLKRKPAGFSIGVPSKDARVWSPTPPDANFVYLQASTACTVDVEVW